MEFKSIAEVKSSYKKPADPQEMRKHKSFIIIKDKFIDGLDKIEESENIVVIFAFHLSEGYNLIAKRRYGERRGVFASRSPRRPNPIGVTTVKLLKRNGNKLEVMGLDAVDGTPILDIKPYSAEIDYPGEEV